MSHDILQALGKRAPKKFADEEARLNREVKRFMSRIKTKSSNSKNIKSARGGLQSLGARGVLVKENDVFGRRVIVKASYILATNKNARARIRHHLNYVGKEKSDEFKNAPELYGPDEKKFNFSNTVDGFESAPHMFNIILSPEDGDKLNLKEFVKDFIEVIEKDLKTKLDWVAGNHYDTNDPHVHLLIKGVDDCGKPLLMKRDYISHGLRARAGQVATRKLGLRSSEEVIKSIERHILSTKKCEIDDIIVKRSAEQHFDLAKVSSSHTVDLPPSLFIKRLEFLQSKNLVERTGEAVWRIKDRLHEQLKSLDRANSIISKMSDSLMVNKQHCEIVTARNAAERVIKGYVIERGFVDNQESREYLLLKSKEAKFIYVELEKHSEKFKTLAGEFVRIDVTKPFSGPLATDKTIEKFATAASNVYDVREHARYSEKSVVLPPGMSPAEFSQIHVNRLELLSRKGLAEKLSEGKFRIPSDYLEKIAIEANKSSKGYQPHIKVIQLSPARLKQSGLHRGLSR